MGRLSARTAIVVDTLSQCEPLAVDVLCDVASRSDLAAAERMGLVSIERTGTGLTARLAHPLFGELRRACAGELYSGRKSGAGWRRGWAKTATLTCRPPCAARCCVSSRISTPTPGSTWNRHAAMTLLDLDLADRFATAATQAGAPGAAEVRAMNLVLLGRGDQAEAALRGDGPRRPARRPPLGDRTSGQPDLDARQAARRGGDPGRTFAAPETSAQRANGWRYARASMPVSARCELAAENSRAALDFPELPPFHAMMASLALIMAIGALGQVDELAGVSEQALRRATTLF